MNSIQNNLHLKTAKKILSAIGQAGHGIVENRDLRINPGGAGRFEKPAGTRVVARSGLFHRKKYHPPMAARGQHAHGMTSGRHQIELGVGQRDAREDPAEHHGGNSR